jgi:hypothetical protein
MKTYDQVRSILSAIEPEEEMYLQLDRDDLPHLQRLLHDAEPWRAARAIHAASRLGTVGAHALVSGAVGDTRREVRAAVAMAAQWLAPEAGNALLSTLLDDEDASIKKLAIKSVNRNATPDLIAKVKALSALTSNAHLRNLAADQLRLITR